MFDIINAEVIMDIHQIINVFGQPIGYVGNDLFCFIIPLEKLMNIYERHIIKFWDQQRLVDETRVAEIARAFETEFNKTGDIKLRGSILLCGEPKNDLVNFNELSYNYYIIDGQHRFSALALLMRKNLMIGNRLNIRIDVISYNGDTNQIKREFQNINKSKPVDLHYLTADDIVNTCGVELVKLYPHAFKGGKCHRPYMSIDLLKNMIIEHDIIENFKITSGAELKELFVMFNRLYGLYVDANIETFYSLYDTKKDKTKRNYINGKLPECKVGKYLYLGLYKYNEAIMWVNYMKKDHIKNWLITNMKPPSPK